MAIHSTVPLRVGLIGVGRHGSRYIRHILHDLPELKLTAICRRDPTRKIEPDVSDSIARYADYRELVAAPGIDAVIVVLPPSLNREVCIAAIQAKKPVLIEKPLATTAADADAIVRAATDANIQVMTAQTLRFNSAIVSLKQSIPEVGARCYVSLTSRMEPNPVPQHASAFAGRGVLLEIGIHLLDLVRFLTEEEIVEVRCQMDSVPPSAPEARVFAWLRMRDDSCATLDISRVSSGRVGRVEWIGERGQLEADWQAHRLSCVSAIVPLRAWTVDPCPTIVSTLSSFARMVREGSRAPISGLDGQRAVEIAEACYQSAQENGGRVMVLHR